MDVKKMYKMTIDNRPKKERLIKIKDKMLPFINSPTLETGVEIMSLCISLTNDYLYCSKSIAIEYKMPIVPDERYTELFMCEWSDFIEYQMFDEIAWRFYCNSWFEKVVRMLYSKNHNDQIIEDAYFHNIGVTRQLSMF